MFAATTQLALVRRSWRMSLSSADCCTNMCHTYSGLFSKNTRSSATTEIARVGGHDTAQCHSSSSIFVQIESPYATSY